ncbi:MAG: NAD(P)/FAD-dependent oxidoreductase [Alphaproteobacteria bacterium]|nr:NAD(P)/FAD-dependent oxidoreductase [Alphaproteobacteria bacterium]
MADIAGADVAVGDGENALQIGQEPPIVAIVGYGCAGIAAAWRLLMAGYRVRVFEALNRYGGRAYTTVPFGADIPIDLGCQWQHGSEWAVGIADHLPPGAQGAIEELGLGPRLEHRPQEIRHHYAHPRNVVYSSSEDLNFPSPESIIGWMYEANEAGDNDDVTVDDAIAAWIQAGDENAIAYDNAPRYLKEFGKAILGEMEEGLSTADYSIIDLRLGEDRIEGDAANAAFDDVEDGYNVPEHGNDISRNGFGSLICAVGEILVACYPDTLTVSLNAPVTQIQYDEQIPDGKVRITSNDNQTDFDAVIVTTSMGVLNHGDLTFVPALPALITAAIGNLPMGNYKKIALRFTQNIFANSRSEADAAVERPGVEYHNDGSIYLLDREAANTWRFLFNFRGTNVVVAIVGGALALELDQLEPDDVRNRMLDALTHTTGINVAQYLADAPNFATSQWSQEATFRGAYSSIAVGAGDPRTTIRHAFPNNNVCFAGEALWNAEYGAAHAALLSGRFAAHKVMQAHPLPVGDDV